MMNSYPGDDYRCSEQESEDPHKDESSATIVQGAQRARLDRIDDDQIPRKVNNIISNRHGYNIKRESY